MGKRRRETVFKKPRSRPRKRVQAPPSSSSSPTASSSPTPATSTSAPTPPAFPFFKKGAYHFGAPPRLNAASTPSARARARAQAAEFAANPPAELPAPQRRRIIGPGSEDMGGALAAAGFSRQHAAARLEATGVQGARNPSSSGNAAALGLPGGGTDNLSACVRDAPLSSAPPPRQPTSRALEPPLPLPPPPPAPTTQPRTPALTVDVPYPPLSPPPLPPGVTVYWSPPSMPPPPQPSVMPPPPQPRTPEPTVDVPYPPLSPPPIPPGVTEYWSPPSMPPPPPPRP